jgi:hypothetical protein
VLEQDLVHGAAAFRDAFAEEQGHDAGVYWQHRERFLALLEWLANLGNTAGMEAWVTDSAAARLLAGRLRNDQA